MKANSKSKQYRIGIVGLGPVGQILAVHLQEAGCDVALCEVNKEKVNLIRKEGVFLEGRIKKHVFFKHVYGSFQELLKSKPDLVVFSVKAHHVDLILDGVDVKLHKLCALSAQNGIDVEEKLSAVFGEENTLRMVINYAGNLHAPNVTNVTFFNPPNYIASIDDSQEKLAIWLARTLTAINLDTVMLDSFSIRDKVWEKTILNASLSALCGISKLTMKEAMDYPDTLDIVEQIIVEAMEVGKMEGIKFNDNFVKLCLRYLKRAGNHFPSLAVDLLNNRETEIDYFNGKIVEYGRKYYIRTPLNLTFTNLVKAATYKNALVKNHTKVLSETVVDM